MYEVGEALPGQAPISKIYNDLLLEIFHQSVPGEVYKPFDEHKLMYRDCKPYPKESSVDTARHISQVCQAWRDIVLHSGTIWGRCMNLDKLDQASHFWRDTVLQRTGKAFLHISGQKSDISSDLVLFRKTLLVEHWERIQTLDTRLGYEDSPWIWEVFGRPSKNLLTFVIRDYALHCSAPSMPPGFQFFSGHAPSLIRIELPIGFTHITATKVLGANVRSLYLQPREMCSMDFLVACQQMPLLETLSLNTHVITGPRPQSPFRISMPRLTRIFLWTRCLHIYDSFLDYIDPSPGYQFHATHTPEPIIHVPDIDSMGRVAERLEHALFEYKNATAATKEDGHIELRIGRDEFQLIPAAGFRISTQRYRLASDACIERLLHIFSTFKHPTTAKSLKLIIAPRDRDFTLLSSAFRQICCNMRQITSLSAPIKTLLYLEEMSSEHGPLFPSLESICLVDCYFSPSSPEEITGFIRRLYITGRSLKVLECEYWPGDLSELEDIAPGLKVVWIFNDYICGSGQRHRLILEGLDHYPADSGSDSE